MNKMKKKIYINISFDDLHPEDWWWNIWDDVMTALLDLKNEFKDIKYTFFTTPNFCYWYNEPVLLKIIKRRLHLLWLRKNFLAFKKHEKWEDFFNILKYKEWCDFIKKYIYDDLFEIWIHWYNHYQKYEVPSAEFLDISHKENLNKIEKSMLLFRESGIKFTDAFRAPGRWNNQFLNDDVISLWFKYISLDPKLTRLIYDTRYDVFYIPQNYSIDNSEYDSVFKHLECNNFLFIKWHLYYKLSNWIRNDTVDNLRRLLRKLYNEFNIEFIFLGKIDILYNNQLKNVYKI